VPKWGLPRPPPERRRHREDPGRIGATRWRRTAGSEMGPRFRCRPARVCRTRSPPAHTAHLDGGRKPRAVGRPPAPPATRRSCQARPQGSDHDLDARGPSFRHPPHASRLVANSERVATGSALGGRRSEGCQNHSPWRPGPRAVSAGRFVAEQVRRACNGGDSPSESASNGRRQGPRTGRVAISTKARRRSRRRPVRTALQHTPAAGARRRSSRTRRQNPVGSEHRRPRATGTAGGGRGPAGRWTPPPAATSRNRPDGA